MASIIDGKLYFGCELEQLADYPLTADGLTFRRTLGKRGFDVPSLDDIAPVAPLVVEIQSGWLVVACPDCADNPNEEKTFVWRDGPLVMFCAVCGNASVGGLWRPVALPSELDAIELALSARPCGVRSWTDPQTVDDVLADNHRFGWPTREEP